MRSQWAFLAAALCCVVGEPVVALAYEPGSDASQALHALRGMGAARLVECARKHSDKPRLAAEALLLLARKHLAGQAYEKAVKVCREVRKKYPDEKRWFADMGFSGHSSWYNMNDFMQSFPHLTSDDAMLLEAECLLQLKKKAEAKKMLHSLVSKRSKGLFEKEDGMRYPGRGRIRRPHRTALKRLMLMHVADGESQEFLTLWENRYVAWGFWGDDEYQFKLVQALLDKKDGWSVLCVLNRMAMLVARRVRGIRDWKDPYLGDLHKYEPDGGAPAGLWGGNVYIPPDHTTEAYEELRHTEEFNKYRAEVTRRKLKAMRAKLDRISAMQKALEQRRPKKNEKGNDKGQSSTSK